MERFRLFIILVIALSACTPTPTPTPPVSPPITPTPPQSPPVTPTPPESPIITPQPSPLVTPQPKVVQATLQNGDFEGAFTVRGNAVTVAQYWHPWWLSSPPCKPGTVGCEIPCPSNCVTCRTSDQGCYWASPEFAAAYQPDYKPPRTHAGLWAQKFFVYGREGRGGLYQQVYIQSRSVLTFTAWFEAWQCFDSDHCSLQSVKVGGSPTDPPADPERALFLMGQWGCGNDLDGPGYRLCKLWTASDRPYAMHMRVGIDPTGGTIPSADTVIWGSEIESYDYWTQASVTAETASAGVVTFFTYGSPTFDFARLNNDVYVDDAALEIEPLQPPDEYGIYLPIVAK